MNNSEIIIYKTEDGLAQVDVTFDGDTVWLSLDQMAELFQRDKSTISRHIKNIFKEGELERGATVAFFATVQTEGLRSVERKIEFYNLDEKELRAMGQLVSGYLDFAERQAEREIPMTMNDWSKHLDGILTSTGEKLLTDNGSISHLQAMEKAETEYKKYTARTLSDVEKDYLDSITNLSSKYHKEGN